MKPDDYIRNNPGHFDTDEPLSGHFDRFDERLEKTFARKSVFGWDLVFKIASAIVIGLMLSYAVFKQSGLLDRSLDYMVTSAESPELREAENFYTMQMDRYYSQIRNLEFDNDNAQKQQILDELSAMDRQVMALKHDLMQNPDDERIFNAIINYYQVKLDFMDMIITKTRESNNNSIL